MSRVRVRAAVTGVVAGLASAVLVSGCSWFGEDSAAKSTSVFSVRPGECFQAPSKVQVELSSLALTPCAQPHVREAYAIVPYVAEVGGATGTGSPVSATAYPGSDVLSMFAKGACAQRYGDYVGVNYLDSSLFFTYLFPSVRSWQQNDDRKIICFVTTTGSTLTGSVKGTKR